MAHLPLIKNDTAGEVSSDDAATPSTISRANGVRRVLACEVFRSHSPNRSTFKPTAGVQPVLTLPAGQVACCWSQSIWQCWASKPVRSRTCQ